VCRVGAVPGPVGGRLVVVPLGRLRVHGDGGQAQELLAGEGGVGDGGVVGGGVGAGTCVVAWSQAGACAVGEGGMGQGVRVPPWRGIRQFRMWLSNGPLRTCTACVDAALQTSTRGPSRSDCSSDQQPMLFS
jgi:hypothetical protein